MFPLMEPGFGCWGVYDPNCVVGQHAGKDMHADGVVGRVVGRTTGPGVAADTRDLGLDLFAGVGAAAGQRGGQIVEAGAGFGQRLVEPADLSPQITEWVSATRRSRSLAVGAQRDKVGQPLGIDGLCRDAGKASRSGWSLGGTEPTQCRPQEAR